MLRWEWRGRRDTRSFQQLRGRTWIRRVWTLESSQATLHCIGRVTTEICEY